MAVTCTSRRRGPSLGLNTIRWGAHPQNTTKAVIPLEISPPPALRARPAPTSGPVIGDGMPDRYWFGDTERISPEAPVPVVRVQRCEERLGGAANVACNVAALGAQT